MGSIAKRILSKQIVCPLFFIMSTFINHFCENVNRKMEKKYELDLKSIGARLRNIRTALDKTIDAMHELSGFSKSLISAAEKGLKKPSPIYLAMLLDKFNASLNFIIGGKGPMFLEGSEPDAKSDDVYLEMLMQMEKHEVVKHGMITQYLLFKADNEVALEKISRSKRNS